MMTKKRTEGKHKGLINYKDGYRAYRKRFPKRELTRSEYSKIMNTYFEEVVDFVLEGGEYKLPARMGIIKIIKTKLDFKKKKIDFKATKELWEKYPECKETKQKVYHLNEHSDMSYYRFYWKKGKVKNISVVKFLPVRGAARTLAKKVKFENKDYFNKR